nr:MAG TPA: HeH/LEM domain [Caudoviricetes sp.]
MTVKELYEWAKENNCIDYDISVECYDEFGETQEMWISSEDYLKKRNAELDVLIKCCD